MKPVIFFFLSLFANFDRSQVKAPGFGDNRKAMLQDIAILTGGQVFNDEVDIKLEQIQPEHLGRAKKITVTKDTTTLLNGFGTKEDLSSRCEEILAQIKETKSEYEKEVRLFLFLSREYCFKHPSSVPETPRAPRQAFGWCRRDQGRWFLGGRGR